MRYDTLTIGAGVFGATRWDRRGARLTYRALRRGDCAVHGPRAHEPSDRGAAWMAIAERVWSYLPRVAERIAS